MATSYTSLLGLALPVTGELSGTWGSTVNTEITALLDSAVAGTTTISSDADVTLTTTTGAANTSRQIILLWTAGGTVTRNITAPAQSKVYVVINKSSSTQSIVLRGVGPTTGVTIALNEKAVCAWNGSDFVKVASTVITNLTGAVTSVGNATSLGSFTSAQLLAALTDETGTGASVFATSPTLVTPALGTPSSGTLTNCTFPTLNQNTTGTAGGLSGTPNITVGTILGGNSQISSLGIGTAASGTSGEIRATNNITAFYSDDRLKTKLGNIQGALAKVKTLSGFYYEANQTAQDLGYEVIREVGVSAQQVQAVMPEVVVPAPIDDKYLTVRYEKLIPLLIEAIKELDAKIESLVKA